MPGTIKKSYDDGDSYNVKTDYDNRYQNNNFCYPHPDSPSAFSHFTTATRRNEEEEYDPDAPVIIRVIAPADLQEGYTIDVLYEDRPYTIEVPQGGVKEGQEFESIIDPKQTYKAHDRDSSSRRMQRGQDDDQDDDQEDSRTEEYSRGEQSSRSRNSSKNDQSNRQLYESKIYDNGSNFTVDKDGIDKEKANAISQTRTYPSEDEDENKEEKKAAENAIYYDETGTPIGGWRTRLFSCCDVLTQSTFWMGIFCTPVLIAQLITRLKLTWDGREGPPEQTSLSFNRIILSLVFMMGVFSIPAIGGVCLFVYCLFIVVYVGSHVRSYMRQKYKIPSTLPTRCGDRVDDVCMMVFCGCCSSIQMARHTHDDKEYPGHGCTTTGLEFDAPEIV
mmetsp:Transcript_12015/g.28496  ORF Transcript_12015/g.28496 Transcript_12015/m.28496 type:complete len:389 (+) Transcript_12015:117-1283(+)|eukprot:CAMPEP_0197191962 /NCGR_PEP_ID=MMETSP1423-20130617/24312_1 /TAXON_ID=476441 /ORGANISM="Pseudo-nitzschia heimii, Strain UNC1101" /LENGTH=388 /DNA_ID=CAMNT_0042644761 /DNA_START=81 /DNA_END=1247 /DNA_ORIENTATION=+